MQHKSLVIQSKSSQKLSNQQKTFNRNIKKVEALQREVTEFANHLDNCLNYYAKTGIVVVKNNVAVTRQTLILLCGFLQKRGLLPAVDKKALKEFSKKLLNKYLLENRQEPDNEIKEIIEYIHGRSFDSIANEEFQDMKEEMKGMFEEMGMDIDLDQLKYKMTEEETARYIEELKEGFFKKEEGAHQHATPNTKGETKRELKERLAREAQNKSIGTIYKTLAKTLHPDLEQDESRKKEKEEIMKKVTAAYQNKDMHTLLKLELEILYKEEHQTDKLSNEKIKIYNDLLQQQLEDLNEQLDMLPEHPKYQHLLRFVRSPDELFHLDLPREIEMLDSKTKAMQISLDARQGSDYERRQELGVLIEVARFSQKMDRQMKKMMRGYPDF